MSASARTVLILAIAGALGGCEWIAGIEDTTVVRDGGQPNGDASSVPPGDGSSAPDAPVPTDCPAPCVADAVRDFADQQGGVTGDWIYAEETPGPFGTSHGQMVIESWEGIEAWVGTGVNPPAIVHCPSFPDHAHCEDVEDRLLLQGSEPSGNDAALIWSGPQAEARTYRMSGDWRASPSAPTNAPMAVLLARNSRFDTILYERFSTRTVPTAFDLELDVLPGDRLHVIAIAEDFSRVPLAMSVYVSGAENAGGCQMAALFPDPGGGSESLFPNACAAQPFLDNGTADDTCLDPSPTCPATTAGEAPPGVPGQARVFVAGASMAYLGEPNAYRGDFTVQFWAYLDGGDSDASETLLADRDCESERGIRVHRQHLEGTASSQIFFEVYYDDPAVDRCVVVPTRLSAQVRDNEWHFFRLTRSTVTESMQLCIDGAYVRAIAVPGDADISATEPMWLGRDVDWAPAQFRGMLADLRVLDRALPCESPEARDARE